MEAGNGGRVNCYGFVMGGLLALSLKYVVHFFALIKSDKVTENGNADPRPFL